MRFLILASVILFVFAVNGDISVSDSGDVIRIAVRQKYIDIDIDVNSIVEATENFIADDFDWESVTSTNSLQNALGASAGNYATDFSIDGATSFTFNPDTGVSISDSSATTVTVTRNEGEDAFFFVRKGTFDEDGTFIVSINGEEAGSFPVEAGTEKLDFVTEWDTSGNNFIILELFIQWDVDESEVSKYVVKNGDIPPISVEPLEDPDGVEIIIADSTFVITFPNVPLVCYANGTGSPEDDPDEEAVTDVDINFSVHIGEIEKSNDGNLRAFIVIGATNSTGEEATAMPTRCSLDPVVEAADTNSAGFLASWVHYFF